MRDFKQLTVWQKAHLFTKEVYRVTTDFPPQELYGLTSQLRRAAVSIPANIAEGCGRATDMDTARFFQIAMGSASETEYYLILTCELSFIGQRDYEQLEQQLIEVKKMLNVFIQKLKANT